MTVDMCDEWHQHEIECGLYPETDWFLTCTDIAYCGTGWTKKDLLEYNKIFEGLS